MHLRQLAAVLAAVGVILAGCGDADEVVEDPTGTPPATETADADDAGDDGGQGGASDGADVEEPDEADGDAEVGLSVELEPAEGWQQADDEQLAALGNLGAGTAYTNEDACAEGGCPFVYALVVPAPVEDPQEYHELSRAEVEDRLGAEISADEDAEIDGHPAHELVYAIDTGQGVQHQLLREAVIDQQAVVVAYTAQGTEVFEEWRADGEAMLDSATVVDAE